jgi:hypothetical protein
VSGAPAARGVRLPCRTALVNSVDHVRQHAQALHSADETRWLSVGTPLGVTAFEAKAYYTIGLTREMIATAGLARSSSLHLGAIFQALDAVELLGRAVGGFRHTPQGEAGKRLRKGLAYALDLNAKASTPLVVLTESEYCDLRNFTGHGAASAGGPLGFDPWTGLALLHLTTRALDSMWADPAAMASFARCQIDPLSTTDPGGQRQTIYVGHVQTHLNSGKMPSEAGQFDDWRTENLQVVLDTASPLVTGF